MKGILPEVRVSRMGIRKKMLLMYATVIFTMTVVTAVIFMWMNKRYAEMLYQETTDSLFLISNEMKLYLDGIEADSYYMVVEVWNSRLNMREPGRKQKRSRRGSRFCQGFCQSYREDSVIDLPSLH